MLGGVLKDRKVSDKALASNFKKNEVRSWILLFAKHVGDKAPNETVTVLPYRQVLPIWQEYVDDIEAGDGQFHPTSKTLDFWNFRFAASLRVSCDFVRT